MRKEYLPGPTGSESRRRVFSTVPLEIDLARSSDCFPCLQLQEPDLRFSGDNRCVDPRTGLAAFGPYGVSSQEQATQIRIGIVSNAEGIDDVLKLFEEMSRPIEQDANLDCVQSPSFPGMNSQAPFRVHLVTQGQWHRTLHKWDFRSLEECNDSKTKQRLLQEMFGSEVRAISELENPPQVVVCAVSERMICLLGDTAPEEDADSTPKYGTSLDGGEDRSDRFLREFAGGFRAECLGILPTEIVWYRDRSSFNGMRDRAALAWSLSLALLHKSGRVPWRIADASQQSCFVGISSYRTTRSDSSQALRAFAHIVTELGNSFVLEGEALDWDTVETKAKAPQLSAGQATRLLSRALAVFEEKMGAAPRKVVVHKYTAYADTERRGFEIALRSVPDYALVTISRRGIFCVRPGCKPILRGTAIPFNENLGLVFTSGYVPFLRANSTYGIPQPLEITQNWERPLFSRSCARFASFDKDGSGFSRFLREPPGYAFAFCADRECA
jgi:hypothetical protein